jgi:carboxypeptidase Taq
VREKAGHLAGKLGCSPYDALLDEYDPGQRASKIDPLFTTLKEFLPGMIEQAIHLQERKPLLKIDYAVPVERQRKLGRMVMKQLGFPFEYGRLDESLHPFTEGTAEDIRITSRFAEDNFLSGLMGVLHETGHAMYDYGLPSNWFLQPVGRDRGMTIHESQALLLEMMIGRSREFFEYAAPHIVRTFQVSGPEWTEENLYRLSTHVRKSFIRMEADELTYPLHVIMRYEMEKEIFDGRISLKNLPDIWNENFRQIMGMCPQTLQQGCLQDSHWVQGYFGYFSTYMLGAMTASQLFHAMLRKQPETLSQISLGNFEPLFAWLKDHVYRYGAKLSPQELVQKGTGETLGSQCYLTYLQNKYLS